MSTNPQENQYIPPPPPQPYGYGGQPQYQGYQQPGYQPTYGQPTYGQPTYEPTYSQPVSAPNPSSYQPPQPQYSTYQSDPVPVSVKGEGHSEPLMDPSIKDSRFNYQEGQWRDLPWLLLFIAHLIGMGILAGVYGPRMIDDANNSNNNNVSNDDNLSSSDENTVIAILAVSAAVGAACGAIWLHVMKRCAANLIKVSMIISSVFLIAAAIVSIAAGIIVMAILYIVILILQLIYFYLVRNRIPFAQATLAASTQAIQDFSGPIYVAYFMAFLSICWTGFWGFTFAAILHATAVDNGNYSGSNDETSTSSSDLNGVAYFCLLVSFYWTFQVLKNIGHVTTSGVVATWWFSPQASSATWGAFVRATTTSLGSICFGSLIVAILQATRQILREAQRNASSSGNTAAVFVLCCIGCLMGCIENLIRYFNMYAYTRVAIYGLGYWAAAKETWDLFVRRGFEAIINDDLTGMVLTMGCVMGGVVTGMVGAIWAAALGFNGWIVVGIIAFIIGFIMVALIMNVIESAVCTTFVVWAEDPATLAATRPEHYNTLREAANKAYPQGQW